MADQLIVMTASTVGQYMSLRTNETHLNTSDCEAAKASKTRYFHLLKKQSLVNHAKEKSTLLDLTGMQTF